MPKRVVENSEIEILSQELLLQVDLIFADQKKLSSRDLDPFVKIFLQLENEYQGNESTFAAYPNKSFLAFIAISIITSQKEPSEELLLRLAPFVSSSPLSDFSFFHHDSTDETEAKMLFLRQQIFSEMLEDFDHQVITQRSEAGEEDPERATEPTSSPSSSSEDVVAVTPSSDLPDDMLDEDLPELRQGLVKVKKA